MKQLRQTLDTVVAKLTEVKKALAAAGSVAATIQAFSGTPTDLKAAAADVLAILGAFGITWKVSNKST